MDKDLRRPNCPSEDPLIKQKVAKAELDIIKNVFNHPCYRNLFKLNNINIPLINNTHSDLNRSSNKRGIRSMDA